LLKYTSTEKVLLKYLCIPHLCTYHTLESVNITQINYVRIEKTIVISQWC